MDNSTGNRKRSKGHPCGVPPTLRVGSPSGIEGAAVPHSMSTPLRPSPARGTSRPLSSESRGAVAYAPFPPLPSSTERWGVTDASRAVSSRLTALRAAPTLDSTFTPFNAPDRLTAALSGLLTTRQLELQPVRPECRCWEPNHCSIFRGLLRTVLLRMATLVVAIFGATSAQPSA